MLLLPTKKSLAVLDYVAETVPTWHHHHFILRDIAYQMVTPDVSLVYGEIGCYAGASACMMIQRPNTKVVSIDSGLMMTKEDVYANVKRFNTHNNEFVYIIGDSKDPDIINAFKSEVKGVHILFIDGDHSYDGAMNDFLNYKETIVPGGFIVFDDYGDPEYPGVRSAVDNIVYDFAESWLSVGTVPNVFNAKGDVPEGNCFIIQKL